MKLVLKIAFVIFVVSLAVSVIGGLQMVWQDRPPSEVSIRVVATSVIIMLAALFYVPVGEALNRIISNGRKTPRE